jgi:hypothetical protein
MMLVWSGGCGTTLTQTFDYSSTSSIRNTIYPLGNINGNYTIRAKVTLWRNNNGFNNLNNALFRLLDGATSAPIYTVNCPATTTCELNYHTTLTQQYKLQIISTAPIFLFTKIFNLIVETYPGTTTFVGNPAQVVLLKLMDVLRLNIVTKFFYV